MRCANCGGASFGVRHVGDVCRAPTHCDCRVAGSDDEQFSRAMEMTEALARAESDKKVRIVFDGLVFVYPFLCLNCGVWTNAEQWAYGRSCARCDVGLRSSFAYDEVRPYIMRFPDGEIVQIALDDMLSLRRTQWGVR